MSATPHDPPIVVAAVDASPGVQALAHYQCDGTADDEEIRAAIDKAAEDGTRVILEPRTYHLYRPVVIYPRSDTP